MAQELSPEYQKQVLDAIVYIVHNDDSIFHKGQKNNLAVGTIITDGMHTAISTAAHNVVHIQNKKTVKAVYSPQREKTDWYEFTVSEPDSAVSVSKQLGREARTTLPWGIPQEDDEIIIFLAQYNERSDFTCPTVTGKITGTSTIRNRDWFPDIPLTYYKFEPNNKKDITLVKFGVSGSPGLQLGVSDKPPVAYTLHGDGENGTILLSGVPDLEKSARRDANGAQLPTLLFPHLSHSAA